jgi:phosphopantetheinyl transferase (holo-ACP synthase)
MVGNDVVDLRDLETRARGLHPRFDARVFACSEGEALRASEAPQRLRWRLWAAKEAAYKVARKLDPRVIFSPARFVVTFDDARQGRVRCAAGTVSVVLHEDGESVHAIATDDGASEPRILFARAIASDPREASRAVRQLAIRSVAERLSTDPRQLRVVRRGRIPQLVIGDTDAMPRTLDLSLSHHGRFVAFACDLERSAA